MWLCIVQVVFRDNMREEEQHGGDVGERIVMGIEWMGSLKG
jgi:hypothetical protein